METDLLRSQPDDDLVAVKKAKPAAATSMVRQVPAAPSARAAAHFAERLELETDPSDVHSDLVAKHSGIVVLDARPREAYERAHVPGARSVPYRQIDEELAASFSNTDVHVVYCWGPGCNAATKAAVRLAQLGLPVKEMIGGIEYWRREGYALASGPAPGSL
jgi:rhodanese-related sulfurtransferase